MQPCIYLRLKVRMSISCGFLEHSKVLSTIGVKLKITDTYSNNFRPYFSHATTFLICNCVKRLRLFFSYKFNHCFHWHCSKFQFNHPNNSIREEYTPKSQFTFYVAPPEWIGIFSFPIINSFNKTEPVIFPLQKLLP